MKAFTVLSWILVVIVALLFGLTATAKLGGMSAEQFVNWGYRPWFAIVIGVVEAVGAVLLLVPRTMRWGVYLLSMVMAGAVVTHLANAEGLQIMRPMIFAAVMWAALYLRADPPARFMRRSSS
jgi:uncharacterized membrane protein YphA (DoxX/SURF4 family)